MEEKIEMGFKEKLDNFWYYHKWHTIVALFVILAIIVCSLQMCSKESYDAYVMYAGPHEFKRTSQGGDISEYASALSSLKQVVSDYDENGDVVVSFLDLYLLTNDEMKEAEKDPETELNYVLINDNKEKFENNVMYSDYYVVFISKSLYELNREVSGIPLFKPLKQYVNQETEGLEFYSEDAVLLSSCAFSALPVFNNLPNDTLVCLRMKSAVASHFGKESTEEQYRRSEEIISKILNYGK